MNKIGFKEIFDFGDDTPIDQAIKKIETLGSSIQGAAAVADKAAGDYAHALNDIAKSAAKLDGDMENLDATLADHQKLIVQSASQAEKLLASQAATSAALDTERIAAEKLNATSAILTAAKEKLNNANLKEAGSLGALRAELAKAVKEAEEAGKANDEIVKKQSLDRVAELTKAVSLSEAGMKQAGKAVSQASSQYDALTVEVAGAKKELKGMEGGIGSTSARVTALNKTVGDGTSKIQEFDKGIASAATSSADTGQALDKLDEASGGAVSGVRKLADGFKLLVLNPVGAFLLVIAGALLSVKEYFEGSVEGQDEFNKVSKQGAAILEVFIDILEGVGKAIFEAVSKPKKLWEDFLALIQPLTDGITKAFDDPIEALKAFGQAIVDNVINRFKSIGVAMEAVDKILNGDFSGGFKQLADAAIQGVTGVTNATDKIVAAVTGVYEVLSAEAKKLADELEKRAALGEKIALLENQIRKDKIADIVDDAQTELAVYKKLNQAQDKLRLSANERFAAQKAAGKLLEDQLVGDLELIGKEITAQKLRIQFSKDDYVAREELARLQAEEIGLQSAFEKAFKKRQATERQLLEEAEKDRLAIAKREADAQRQLNEVITKAHIDANKEQIADDRTTLSDRISLINENAELSRDVASSNLDRDLSAAREAGIERVNIDADILDKIYSQQGASAEQINAARREAAIEALATDQAYIDEIAKLNEQFKNETIRINDETVQETADNVFKQWERDYNNMLANIDAKAAVEALGLNQALEDGNISFQDFQDARAKIQEQAQIDSLTSQLGYLKQQEAAYAAAGHDTTQLAASIAETELALSDAKNAKLIEGQKLLDQKLGELKTVAKDTALAFIDNMNAAEDMRREERLAKLDETYQTELTMAGDNDVAKAELTNAYNLEKDKIDKEQRAADRKRAIFQKTLAAVEIAINTAKGIGMALGSFPPPVSFALAAVVGVIGALQIAAVLSKPIPAFAEGTDDAPGGWSLINERGDEAVTDSKGTRVIHSNGPRLIHLEKHAIVHTAEEVAAAQRADRMISGYDDDTQKMRHVRLEVDHSAITSALAPRLDVINETLRGQKNPIINPKGLAREVARGVNMAAFEASEYK